MSIQDQKVSFDQFRAGWEAAGLSIPLATLKQMAADSGAVDLSTIPVSAMAEVVEYTPKRGNGKTPNLYATVQGFVTGKLTKAHFGRLSNLRRDVEAMRAALPALEALVADLDNGAENTSIPDGWTVHDSDEVGFQASKA